VANTSQARLKLQQSWVSDLPLKFLWTISLDSRTGGIMTSVGENIQEIVNDYEPGVWRVDPPIIDSHTDTTLGYLLAQAVALPTEQLTVGVVSVDKSGGFVSGYYGDRRQNYGSEQKIDITFLESNKDIFDFFIKPWIVAGSYKGLIEDDERDIKCNITLTEYSRVDAFYDNKWASSNDPTRPLYSFTPRKSFVFYNCVPTNIAAESLSYGELGISDLTRVVSFVFSHYRTIDQTAL